MLIFFFLTLLAHMKLLTFKTLITGAVLSYVSLQSAQAGVMPDVQPVASVNLTQYAGTWYEQARFPMFFQRKCAQNVQATYSLNADGTIHVLNQCEDFSNNRIKANGTARATNAGNSTLKVSFAPKLLARLPFTQGDYWILKLDPDYQVALVGSPSRRYLWVLSRHPHLDEATYQEYVAAAKAQGFDITQLKRTKQVP